MESEHDFAALRNLLALRKLEVPADTEVNRFLIEFHRRQRAQLLVPESRWARAKAWIEEQVEGWQLAPSLSYASGFAAVAFLAFVGLSQQTQVSGSNGGGYRLALHMPSSEASFAMVPASFVRGSTAAPAKTDPLTFNPSAVQTSATRFVLANTRVAYDATVAF